MICQTLEEAQALEAKAWAEHKRIVPDTQAVRWAEISQREDGRFEFPIEEHLRAAFTVQEWQRIER